MLDRQQEYQKVSTHLTTLTTDSLKVSYEKKILTQFITTHHRGNTCGIEGETTLTSFKNTVNTKTPITVAQMAQQFCQISRYLMTAK
jgi:hypothetical protein